MLPFDCDEEVHVQSRVETRGPASCCAEVGTGTAPDTAEGAGAEEGALYTFIEAWKGMWITRMRCNRWQFGLCFMLECMGF